MFNNLTPNQWACLVLVIMMILFWSFLLLGTWIHETWESWRWLKKRLKQIRKDKEKLDSAAGR
jgi:hypothetical protein